MDEQVPNYWPGQCFGCSPVNAQGLRLSFRRTAAGVAARCTVPDHLCGFDGLVHGGIICTLLDEVAAWTLLARLARMGVTAEMSVRYLKPAPTGTELLLEGQITSHDERGVVTRSTLSASDGTLLAEAVSTWRFLPLATLAKLSRVDEATLQQVVSRYAGQDV